MESRGEELFVGVGRAEGRRVEEKQRTGERDSESGVRRSDEASQLDGRRTRCIHTLVVSLSFIGLVDEGKRIARGTTIAKRRVQVFV